MTWTTVVPLLVLVATSIGVTLWSDRLHPRLATWILTGLAAMAVVSVVAVLLVLTLPLAASSSRLANIIGWCFDRTTTRDRRWLGSAAGLTLTIGAARSMLAHRVHRSMVPIGDVPVLVLSSNKATAYAVPGGRGQVVVTSAMLDALNEEERRAMFAHEQAHLALGHHRFIRFGDLCASLLPVLRPLSRRITHATERWADEVAADRIGSRSMVARAVALAGLASAGESPTPMTIATIGVPARVQALLTPPSHDASPVVACVGGAALCAAMVATQLHHLATLLSHLC